MVTQLQTRSLRYDDGHSLNELGRNSFWMTFNVVLLLIISGFVLCDQIHSAHSIYHHLAMW